MVVKQSFTVYSNHWRQLFLDGIHCHDHTREEATATCLLSSSGKGELIGTRFTCVLYGPAFLGTDNRDEKWGVRGISMLLFNYIGFESVLSEF